ncbi:ATP-binding protein [Teredinibacter purpureus]|uniref:ATP-binding protein n=1 Tax=Teredinibacter purpureus TaxID=2731756 RepID=UPI0005F77476|nr:SbcC/MukB-like Walker B domain-containing protein [Teredinibacter purpureus]
MFLKRGVFVNWGNIPHLEFDFGPINLFSGGNGSGKTTAADAIQTLMTAAHENLFNYNPGQDETTQRGRGGKQVRTLASYVLGCDDGSYARPHPTDGYVAGIFHPTQGESGEVFTAVMCMRAHVDNAGTQKQARLDDLTFLVVPGEQLALSHFVREFPDGKHIIPITDITTLLKKEFGSKTIEVYDKKGAYLRRLYGALRGRREAVSDREAKHAARTFSNFMAYKPVKSINEFVAREIMEPKDLGDAIRNVSELMKTIHQMESDTKAIRDSIETLTSATHNANRYVDTWMERRLADYTEASRRLSTTSAAYINAKTTQKETHESLLESENKIQQCEQRRRQTHEDIIALEAQRQGISALKDKDALEQAKDTANRELTTQARPLLEQHQQLETNIHASQQLTAGLNQYSLAIAIPALESKAFRNLAKSVTATAELSDFDLTRLLGNDWIDTAPLESFLHQVNLAEVDHRRWVEFLHRPSENGNSGIRDQISLQLSNQNRKRDELQTRLRQKQKEVQLLNSRKVSYPPYVETAIAAIQKHCPQADPRVLCDYIEVLDPQWQMAIEGYIGGARFSLIVEQDYEAEAIRIVRNLSDSRRNRARVIQGYKAQRDAERLSLPQQSVTDVMSFSHKTAEHYLKASYGSVVRVNDAKMLRSTSRGITPEGLASGNYSMWRCDLDDSELVFGQGARERALKAKENECEKLAVDANSAEQDYQSIARIFESVEAIKTVQCADVIQTILNLHRDIQSTESALERLDLSDFEHLECQLHDLKTSYLALETQSRDLVKDTGRLQERERQNAKKVTELADAVEIFQEAQEDAEVAIERISDWNPEFDYDQALSLAEQRAQQAGTDFNFEEEAKTLFGSLEKIERELYQTILRHNQQCNPHDAIVYDTGFGERHDNEFFQRLVKLRTEVDLIHNRLKNNVLVDRYEQLTGLKDNFNTAFVTNLCHSIYQAIGEGERTLKHLNSELEGHRFGADQERFYFGYEWVPEFRDYWRFFQEVINIPNLGDGSNLFDAELSPKACIIRDKMLVMLLDTDEQVALRELNRISDYRNYRNYEIYKEPLNKAPIALSQYGTGSGGQLETPAYIIRSAAVTSAFRFSEGNAHLRMVLVDEAFSKMDETRSREVIHYLTETLGLQLVFIMPTSKSGPFMDLISNQFVFSKCPTAHKVGELNTRVLVDRKACNQEKIKELWANHRKTVRHQGMLDFMDGI